MLKVLHLDTGRDLRGGQWQLLMLARSLQKRECEQLIVCPEGSPLAAEAANSGLEAWGAPLHGLASLKTLTRLRHTIANRGFNVLHAHDGRAQTISWLATCGASVCRVASRRVTFLPRSPFIHRIKYTHTCHGVIAVSSFVREMLIQSGIPPGRIEMIPDGVSIPESLPDSYRRAELRRMWQLEETDFVIGHAGAFTAEKGHAVLLKAFYAALASVPNARLLLAGDGPLRKSLQAEWRSEVAGGRVQFLGYLSNLSPMMNCLDLFIMPSLKEGFGSSAIIAMAHGVPVAASRVGGLPEAVEDGKTGWLVPPDDAPALARAIIVAAADGGRRLEIGKNAREKARLFSDDIMAERTINFYRRTLQKISRG